MEKKRVNIRNAYSTEDYVRDQFNLLREGTLSHVSITIIIEIFTDPDAILDAIGREVSAPCWRGC